MSYCHFAILSLYSLCVISRKPENEKMEIDQFMKELAVDFIQEIIKKERKDSFSFSEFIEIEGKV